MEDVGNFSNTDTVKSWLNLADANNGVSDQQSSNGQYRISDTPEGAKVLKKVEWKS